MLERASGPHSRFQTIGTEPGMFYTPDDLFCRPSAAQSAASSRLDQVIMPKEAVRDRSLREAIVHKREHFALASSQPHERIHVRETGSTSDYN